MPKKKKKVTTSNVIIKKKGNVVAQGREKIEKNVN